MPPETVESPLLDKPLPLRRVIPSGSLKLDIALGTGGYLAGTLVEISGAQSSGKSCLCLHAMAEAQRLGGLCALVDADRSLSIDFARRCGVRTEELYYCEPKSAEQAFDTVEILAGSGAFSLIVLDSIQSLVPEIGIIRPAEKSLDEWNQELLANSLIRLSRLLKQAETTVIITHYASKKMSAVYHDLAMNPSRLAIKLYSGMQIRLEVLQNLSHGSENYGIKVRARIPRGKFIPLLNTIDFDIIYEQGIYKSAEIFALGIFIRKIQKRSTGYTCAAVDLGKTPSEALHSLEENQSLRDEVEREVRRKFLPNHIIAAT